MIVMAKTKELAKARKEKGISMQSMADKLEITLNTYFKMEHRNFGVKAYAVIMIPKVLDCDFNDVFELIDVKGNVLEV